MKREAWNHPKLKLLARDLGLPLCYVNGVVESIWLVTSDKLPAGDIGRWSNEEIAASIEYPGDPDKLIAALLKRKLLDSLPPENGRLYVHDWHEHSDRYTNLRLVKSCQNYANGIPARRHFKEQPPRDEQEDTRKNAKERKRTRDDVEDRKYASRARALPEPEPEPEPVTLEASIQLENTRNNRKAPLQNLASVLPANTWKQDTQFCKFVADYLQTGAALIDEDFATAWQFCWRTLDFEQKLERCSALVKHSEEYHSNPRFVPKPQKFLETEWKRPPKPPAASPTRKLSMRERIKAQLAEEKNQRGAIR